MFIELGQFHYQLLILLIYPIGIILARILYRTYNNPYFSLFCFFISHYLVLIIKLIYIIKNCFLPKENEEIISIIKETPTTRIEKLRNRSTEETAELETLESEKEENSKKNKILGIIFISVLYFLCYTFFYYANLIIASNFYGNVSMIMEIIYFSLFNKIILGNKIYSHHFISMIIIFICILGLYILIIVKYTENNDWEFWRDVFLPIILNLLAYFIYCYHLALAKFYIEKYFISLYELLFYLGSLGLIILIVFEPFTFLIPCDKETMCIDGHLSGIISGFNMFSNFKEGFLVTFGMIIFLFMTAFGLWLTVIYLSPSHFLTSDSIITFGLNVMIDGYSENFVLLNNPLFYILSIINIFACLIYNEIIIIKACNLHYNTRKEILKRQNKESMELLRIETINSEGNVFDDEVKSAAEKSINYDDFEYEY